MTIIINATTIRIWLQSTNTFPQTLIAVIAIHHIAKIPAYGKAQYLRHFQQIAGSGLNGIISQFQSVQQRSEKHIR